MAKFKKNPRNGFFTKSQKPEIRCLGLIRYFGQNCPKTAKIEFLRVKKWFYVIDIICWHILAKLKKNPRNGFFAKSQKPRNDVKFASDVNILGQKRPKTAKIGFLRVKKWSYVIDNFFWHILGKFKKIPRNGFFSKSQKPQNDVKYGVFELLNLP